MLFLFVVRIVFKTRKFMLQEKDGAKNRKKAFTIACDFAAITHGHPTGYLCAGFLASVISDLAINTDIRKAIENAIVILKKWNNYNETLTAIENCLKLYEHIKNEICQENERKIQNNLCKFTYADSKRSKVREITAQMQHLQH